MSDSIIFHQQILYLAFMSEKNEWENNFLNTFRLEKNENCAENCGNLIFYFIHLFIFYFYLFIFLCWSKLPSSILNERSPEIGANPTLHSNLWKKVTLIVVLLTTEKGQRIVKLSFGTTKMVAFAKKVYVCLFMTKNMEMFVAMGLTVKR